MKGLLRFLGWGAVAVLVLFVALLVFVEPDPEAGYCNTTSLLVERRAAKQRGGPEGLRSEGPCIVTGEAAVRRVAYAYSTPASRRNGTAPIRYVAVVARDRGTDTYHLCSVRWLDGQGGEEVEPISEAGICDFPIDP